MKTLADRVNFRMKQLGFNQEDLAKRVGISQAAIHKITSGQTEKPRCILDLAKALGVTPQWLTNGIGEEPDANQIPLSDEEKQFLFLINSLPNIEKKKLMAELEEKSKYFKEVFKDLKQVIV